MEDTKGRPNLLAFALSCSLSREKRADIRNVSLGMKMSITTSNLRQTPKCFGICNSTKWYSYSKAAYETDSANVPAADGLKYFGNGVRC